MKYDNIEGMCPRCGNEDLDFNYVETDIYDEEHYFSCARCGFKGIQKYVTQYVGTQEDLDDLP